MTTTFIDVTGKTEDEAVSAALAQLGMDRDQVSVEVLERAKKGFLGIGASPAKVRVTYAVETPAPISPQPITSLGFCLLECIWNRRLTRSFLPERLLRT